MNKEPNGFDENETLEIETQERISKIRKLNDDLRQSLIGGQVVMTPGIISLPIKITTLIIDAIRAFDGFTDSNDPYREHDFGEVEIQGQKAWFKIDYYDKSLEYGSPDPSDPNITTRVMTVLTPSEY